jgi:hypothetical protein
MIGRPADRPKGASTGRGRGATQSSMDRSDRPESSSGPGGPTGELEPRASATPVRVEEPPVVARLMVEIRSDGSYTVARGAMEDALSGQKVAVEATGSTPLALALSLAKSLASTPWLARHAFRALLRR